MIRECLRLGLETVQLKVLKSSTISYTQWRLIRSHTGRIHNVGINNESPGIRDTSDPLIPIKSSLDVDANRSVLQPVENTMKSDVVVNFPPTFNLAAYVNKSESLQQLLKLGVNLSKIERRKGLGQFILKLDFDRDMKNHVRFLNDVGVSPDSFGEWITKNPLIFKEDMDNLVTRVNYLQSKNFQPVQIARIVSANPYWLMFTTQRIDKRLGFFQKNFKLSGNALRELTVKCPRLITYKLERVRENDFSIRQEMGFDKSETTELLLKAPKLWMIDQKNLLRRFDYAHRQMNLSHTDLIQNVEVLLTRDFRIKQRHEFLKSLGKNQYDPLKDLYVAPSEIVKGTDLEFVTNIAKTHIDVYDAFLRTL